MAVNLIIGLVLVAHGIGHVLGLLPIAGIAAVDGWTTDSWLLAPLGTPITNLVAAVLFLVPLVGFTVVGLGVIGAPIPATWMRPLAVAASVASIVAIGCFWHAFPAMTGRVGAVAVDVLVLWAVLTSAWPTSDTIPGG